MDINFTHILCIKLLNTTTNELLVDEKLLNIIKDIVSSATQIESLPYNNSHDIEVTFNWRIVEWPKPYLYTIEGDLTTKSEYDNDKIIYDHTSKMLLGIETFLKTKYAPINDGNWSIIFNITKPLLLLKC
jgi:hypothetical protein